MRTVLIALALLCAGVGSASAQRLTVESVTQGYTEAVVLCAKALRAGGVANLSDADRALVGAADEATRQFIRAPEGRPAWDILSARGIVTISEVEEGHCNVSAYGPPVRPVFAHVGEALRDLGLSEGPPEDRPDAIIRTFTGEGVVVRLDGGEPGMPGRMFRFPMLLAFGRATR